MNQSMFDIMKKLWEEFWPQFMDGTIKTLEVAILGTLLGFLLGFLIGGIKSIPNNSSDNFMVKLLKRVVKIICAVFVEVFRDTPMMVQAMVIYYGIKQSGYNITPFSAAILITLLNTGAYMAETVRAGITSIDKGQNEGAVAIGMSHMQTMLYVIFPQAFKNIIPEMCNNFLTNLKMTSVLNVIGISELYFVTKTAANTYYHYFESYLIVGIIYFILCFVFSRLLSLVEKIMAGKSDYELAAEYME